VSRHAWVAGRGVDITGALRPSREIPRCSGWLRSCKHRTRKRDRRGEQKYTTDSHFHVSNLPGRNISSFVALRFILLRLA